MIRMLMGVTAALALLVPASARAQQNPALIGKGAQVYSANCGRCHNARSSTEQTDSHWATIVKHMRARANLTRSEAEAVLAYLQAANLAEGSTAAVSAAERNRESAGAASHAARASTLPSSPARQARTGLPRNGSSRKR